MKKIQLNKQIIASLDNPNRIFGGEDERDQPTANGRTTCPSFDTKGWYVCAPTWDCPPTVTQ